MTPQVLRSFGEKRAKVSHLIRHELGIRGWSQAKVARVLGYSEAAVSKAINGQGHSEVVLVKLREIGVPEECLFDPRRAGVPMRGFGRAKTTTKARAMSMLRIDVVQADGKPLTVVVTDTHSRQVSIQCSQDTLSQGVADCLTEAIKEFGVPQCVVTDNSSVFASDQLRQRFLDLGVTHLQPSPYIPHPRVSLGERR